MKMIFRYLNPAKNLLKAALVLLFLFSGIIIELSAQSRFSVASGNWDDPAVWSATSGGTGGATPPVAGDVVRIERGFSVTVNISTAVCTSLNLGGAALGTGSGTLTFSAGQQLTVSGAVVLGNVGATDRFGNLTMTAGGLLICQSIASNSTTDIFNEGAGTVQLATNNTLPVSDIGNQFGTFNNLTINGGTTTIGKSISITGTLNVNAGTFALGTNNVNPVGAVILNGTSIAGSGTLTLAGNVTTAASPTSATINTPINLGAGTRTFDVNVTGAVPDLLLTGAIVGSGALIKAGNGSMTVAASSTYGGSTTINAGTLRIAFAGGAIPNASAVIVNATLDLNGNSETVGSIAGAGTITSSAGGFVTLTTGGNNTNTSFSGLIQNGSATSVALVKNGTGALTLTGANSYSGGTTLNAGTLNINNASALGNVSSTLTINGGAIDNTTAGALTTTDYPQAWNGDFAFTGTRNLNLGTGPVTLNANRQITVTANTLTVGGIVIPGTADLTKLGAGTLSFGSNAITLRSLNVNAGNLISTSGALNLSGDLNVTGLGSFTHNSGTVNFNGGTTQSVAGVTYNDLNLSGTGQKNASGNVVVANLDNSSVFDMGLHTLLVSGTTTNTGTFRFSGASNGWAISTGIVEYYGASQTVTAGTYNDLVINQSSGQAIVSGSIAVNGTLTMSSGNLNLIGSSILDFAAAPNGLISGASATRMIICTTGSEVRKSFTAAGSFTFPIGDNIGATEYSPITVDATAGGFPTNIGISVVDAKHPNNASATNFISRYWNVFSTSGVTANIIGTYPSTDISGTEGSISSAQLNGSFNQTINPWTKFVALAANTLNASGATLTAAQTSAFTGITGANPSVSITGGGITICFGSSVPLTATVIGGDPSVIYSWSPVAGLSNATVDNPTASPTATTPYTVSIRDGNGILATSVASTLTVQTPAPAANAGSDQSLCNTSGFTLAGNAAAPGTGTWSYVSGFAGITITTPGSNVSTVTGLTAGNSVTLRWTISNGVCSSTQDDVTLTNSATPSVSNAGLPSITQCNTSTFVMNATVPVVGSGTWTVFSGTATITNATSATTTITGISAGASATLRWTVLNGSCVNPFNFDDIVLTNTAPAPVANAASDQNLCNTSSFTLAGNAAAPGTGTWSYVSGFAGITITTPGSNVSTVTGLTAGNSVTLRWTISNGVCSSTQDDVTLTNSATPSVSNAGLPSITQCNTSTFVMNATVPVVGSGTWTVFSGTATITNATSATTTITGISAGASATLRWTVLNGSCVNPLNFDDIVLTNTAPAPAANAASDQNLCNTSSFTLAGNAAAPGTGTWSYVSGFAGITITTPGSNVNTVTGLTAGNSVTLRWTISNGVCSSTQDDVTLTNSATPSAADAGLANITQCNTSTFLMNATVPVVGSGTWSVSLGSATITNASSATTTITGIAPGASATLTWTVGNGSCSTTSDNIILTNSASTPVANANVDQLQCNNPNFTLAGNAPAPGTGTWSYVSGFSGIVITTPGSNVSTVTGLTAGNNVTLRWTISNGACGSFDDVILTNNVNPFVTAPSNQILCAGSTTTAVTFAGSASQYSWTNDKPSIGLPASGVGNIAAFTALNSTGSPIIATIAITPTSGICIGTVLSFTITVNPNPSFTASNSAPTICSGSNTNILFNSSTTGHQINVVSVNYNGATGGTVVAGTTTFTNGNTLTETLTNSTNAPIDVVYTFNVTTPSSTPICPLVPVNQVVTVRVYPRPNALASSQSICSGSTSNIVITNPNNVSGTTFSWTIGAVTGTVSGQLAGNGTTISQTLTSVLGGSVLYIITPSANGCPGAPLAPITVTVNPIPVGNSVAAGTNVSCSGTSLNIVPTLNAGSGTFTWNGSNGSGGSGNITDAPVNTTPNPINITYTVIPRGLTPTFCVGAPFTIVVTVNPNPSFTANNSAPTICSGSNTNILFNSSTTGHQINVVSVNYNGATGGTVVAGATFTNGNTLTEALTNSTNAPIDVVYTFNVTTPSSTPICPLVPVNQVVTVRIYPVPNASAITPQTICSGTTTNVVITNPNAVSGTTFTWTVVGPSNVTGATTGNGSLISQLLTSTDGVSAGSLTYRITPSANGCAGNTFDVVMNVTPKTVITNPAPDFVKDICSATPLNFTPTSSVSGTSYTWTSSVIGTLTGVSANGVGAITDTPVNATNANAVIIYTVTPSVAGCAGNPVNVVVTVHPVPAAAASNQIICSNSSPAIAISNPNLVAGTTYSWTVSSSTNATGAAAGTGNNINQVLTSTDGLNNGTVNYSITPSANGCAGVPITVSVTVKPIPVLTNAPASFSQQICSGQALNFIPTSSIGSTGFAWTSVITGTISPGSITASGSGPITNTPINTGNTSGTVRYIITPTANGCVGLSMDLIVTVKPLPSASGTDVTICSGENTIITISPAPVNVAGTTFSWTAAPSSNIIGAANGNGSTINQILSTNNASLGTVAYSITPSANGCNGPVTILTANVNPKATVNAGIDFSVCETLTFPAPMTIPINGTIGGSATSGSWTVVSGTGSISSSTASGSTVTATYTVGAGDIASQVTLRLTTNDPDVAGPCTVVSDDLVINISRRARVTLPSNFTVCEPGAISLSGTLSGSATSGLWSLVSPNTGTLSSSSVTGSTVSASYLTALPADVTTTLIFKLTTNDPDGFGPCIAESANIDIHINESAKVNAGFDFEVCEDQVVSLNGSFSGATSSVIWSGGSGTAQFGNVNNAVTTYTLTPVDIAGGSITLTLKTNDPDGAGPCTIVSDVIIIKINKLPTVFISGVETTYAENAPVDFLDGFPLGGTFTGPGIVAGTNQFNPANAGLGPVTITYTYTDPITGCDNFITRSTIVNPVTTVDFYVKEDNRPDVNGFPQICANQGQLTLIGIPPVGDPASISASFVSLSPALTPFLINVATNWYINTDGLPSGTYQLQYVFTNIFNATTTITKKLIVFAAPLAVIDVTDNCIDGPVTFLESSVMTDGSPSSNIVQYDWFFGEGTNGSSGAVAEPVYLYTTAGTRTVTLTVTTGNNEFCSNTDTKTITIGTPPVPDFIRSSFCKGDVTIFQDQSSAAFGTINSYLWDFDDAGATSTVQNPSHTYSGFGTFDVKLTVGTDAGCSMDTTKTIFIVDSPPPLVSSGYTTDFEMGIGTWVSVIDYEIGGTNTSWQFGQPNGAEINTAASGTNAWWTGANNQSFYSNEKSYVIGPCMDIQNLKRPMISLNYWSDTQKGFDGAVLQYSDDGGLNWKSIGDADGEGINWYNSRNLPGKPGNEDNFAWSDTLGGWRNARFNLEQIDVAKRNLIVFRIAFGSNNDNTGRKYNGFAFDDIYIGEKKRNVLLEHFTNSSSSPSGSADTYLDNLYRRSFNLNARDSSDVINLQYHIANPGLDPINADNPDDPSARRLYYGVSQPPFTIMDGIVGQYYDTNFDGSYAYITDEEIDRRALEDPAFSIAIDTLAANNRALNLSLTYTYIDPVNTLIDNPVILHAALVESGVNAKRNYLRKLLLQSEGKFINKTWNNGTLEVVPVNYTIDVPIAYPDSLSIIAFIQDKNSGRILQSAIRKVSRKIGSTVVGIEDNPALAEIIGLKIYPNPVSNTLNLQLENDLHNDYAWKMIDQRGVVVLEGNLNRDLSSPQTVDVSRLADGIYVMAIQSGEKSLVYRKIAVINRNH